jgi:hypothetical protein
MFIRTQVSKEDVRGDDHVRVVTVTSISVYYPFLLSVRVDGSGVNPRASICFNASADAFAEEKRLIGLRRMIWRYFVLLIGEGASPEVDPPVARCSIACNSRSSRPPNLLASCPLQAVPVSGAVVAYFLLLNSFTLLGLFQMCAVGQLDSVRSAKNVQPI